MKNILKIVIMNFIFIIFFLVLLEIISFSILIFKYENQIKDCMKSYEYHPKFSLLYQVNDDITVFTAKNDYNNFRKPIIIDNNKRPILIFGCSFAAGDLLDEKYIFSTVISKLTDRTTYNRGFPGTGPQVMLYQLSSDKFKYIVPDCEYVIYLYAADAIKRTIMTRNWPFLWQISPKYIFAKNNKLKLIKINNLLAHSYMYRLIESSYPYIYGKKYCSKLFFEIIKESYIQSQNIYPNSKFVVFAYKNDIQFKEELEKLGIKVITLKDLTNENMFQLKYQISKYNGHPNEKAWEFITPLFVQKIGIK